MLRKILTWALILAMNVHQLAWAQSSGTEADYQQALDRLGLYMDLLHELRSYIDRSQFDTEVLLDTLDYDVDQIVAFVRDEIYFEQYPGLLRGIQGTLSSRAGNSLDQAFLLATLLKDAGLDARIVRSTLTEEEAHSLILGLLTERTSPKELGDIGAMREAVALFCQELALDCGELESSFDSVEGGVSSEKQAFLRNYQDTAIHLFNILEQEGISLGKDGSMEALVQEARDYFWVEVRQGLTDAWVAAHPAFGGTEPEGLAPELIATYTDEIPRDLQHRVGFEVVMQQKLGTNEVEHELVASWERPSANLDLLPLTFSISSKNLAESAKNPGANFDPEQIHTDLFFPSFSGGSASTAFDFAGNAVAMDVAASVFAGVFQTGSAKLNRAAGALSTLGSSEPDSGRSTKATEVSAILTRFTSISPSGERRQYQRTVYDSRFSTLSPGGRSDPATRDEDIYRSITRVFTFQVQTGSTSAAQVLDSQLEALLQRRSSLELILGHQHMGEGVLDSTGVIDVRDQISWTGLTMLARIFDEVPGQGHRAYRDRPNIIVHHKTIPMGNAMQEAVDIVQNSRRAYSSDDGSLVADPNALLRAGVWETVTEGELLLRGSGPSIRSAGPFTASREGAKVSRVITDLQEIDRLELSTVSMEALKRDNALGYAVVLSAVDPDDDTVPTAWWRIDPDTGETLGMGFNGEGTAIVSQATLLKSGLFILAVTGAQCVVFGGEFWYCLSYGAAVGGLAVGVLSGALWPLVGAAIILLKTIAGT